MRILSIADPLKSNAQVIEQRIVNGQIDFHDVTVHHPLDGGGFVSLGTLFGEKVAVKKFDEAQEGRFVGEIRVR
jgi:hypothetical protein